MEMESSRGGRSRQQSGVAGVKKARLMSDEDQQRRSAPPASVKTRAFPNRPSATTDPRLRKNTTTSVSGFKERDSSTSASMDTSRERDRGLSSFQLRQMQELISEYKIALAELTFNSKPIITNMTIIAGENLEASKGIAASICANILQVPSDQKLPSLYLLDSIVKNIGSDYIKHFASRLPEVFCKAYKQVDAPIHSGMRHLFGTWKGVFPSSALQYIEKELGFSSVSNGSSAGGTTSRTDSQTARPPHSIHVNPKYLDAKQLLQNANRSKAPRSDIDDMDIERIDRASVAGSTRQWNDLHAKNIHRPTRGLVNDTSEKGSGLSYGDNNKLVSDRSRFSDLKMGRNSKPVTEKAALDNSWYEIGNRNPDLPVNQRNKSDAFVHGNFKTPRSHDSDQQFPGNHSAIHKRNKVTPGIWKNSEEEEYMWDNKNSKSTGQFNNDSVKSSIWASDDDDKGRGLRREKCIGTQWNRNEHYDQVNMISGGEERNPYFRGFVENLPQSQTQHDARLRNNSNDFSDPISIRGSFSGHQSSSSRPYQEPEFGQSRIGSRFSSQLEGNQVHSSSGLSTSYTPPHGSEMHDFQESQSYSQADKKLSEILGESDKVLSSKISAESFPSIPSKSHHQSHSLSILQQALSQSPHDDNKISASSSPYIEPWNLTTLLHSQTPVEVHPQISIESQRQSGIPYASTNSNAPEIESSGESSTSSLLASIMKSGLISKNPSSTFQHLNLQPPGPPQIPDVSSVKISLLSTESAKTLPLPPGPPPLVSSATDTAEENGNPLSSLLSSLVAKGLISSKVEPQDQTGVQKPNQLNPTTQLSNSASEHATSIPVSSCNPSSSNELSLLECSEAKETALLQDEAISPKDLIGVEFKSEVLRSFNPIVISSLFDDLKHQCKICGLRFQLNNKLRDHLDWHDSKSSELNQRHRKWYLKSIDSTPESVERHSNLNIDSAQTTDTNLDKCDDDDPMVLADETQCICALCGEPFEDFYCLVRDEWMYKGTRYLPQPDGGAVGIIVHVKCTNKIIRE